MKKRKKEIEKGLDSIIKTTKKDFKSWAEINTENYLKKNKRALKKSILDYA